MLLPPLDDVLCLDRRAAEETGVQQRFVGLEHDLVRRDLQRRLDAAAQPLLQIGRVQEGDLVVIIAGSPPGIPGSTNALRIHKMGDAMNQVAPAYRRS